MAFQAVKGSGLRASLAVPRIQAQSVLRTAQKPASFSTRAYGARPQTKQTRWSRGAALRPFCASATLSAGLFSFFSERPIGTTNSGSVLREASPAAPTKQAYTLVFVSSDALSVPRSKWQAWIYYFREAGYDCIDLKIEPPKDKSQDLSEDEMLSRELIGQIRDSSLQREPVVFIRDGGDAILKPYMGKGGFLARRGPMSGLVLLHPTSEKELSETNWPSSMPVLVVPKQGAEQWEGVVKSAGKASVMTDQWSEKEQTLKEVERWLRNMGL